MTKNTRELYPVPRPIKKSKYDYLAHFGNKTLINQFFLQMTMDGAKKDQKKIPIFEEFCTDYDQYAKWCDTEAPEHVHSDKEARATEEIFHKERIKMAWLNRLIKKALTAMKIYQKNSPAKRGLNKNTVKP